jgi:hypothetical protein
MGASIAEQVLPGHAANRAWIVLAAAIISIAPDFDFGFVWIMGLDRTWHRGFTHSIPFAIAIGGILAATNAPSLRTCIALTLALLAHGLLDWATTLHGGGVELFWPVSSTRFRLGAFGLSELGRAAATDGTMEILARAGVACLIEAAVFLPVFLLSRALRRARVRNGRA